MTRRFAMDLGPYGVTVNAIAPGFILTDMARAGRNPDDIARVAEKAMVKRVGQPEDIAHAVTFLCQPESGLHHRAGFDGGWRPHGLHRTSLTTQGVYTHTHRRRLESAKLRRINNLGAWQEACPIGGMETMLCAATIAMSFALALMGARLALQILFKWLVS